MNRINNYVLNGAIALLSTAGFVACSSSDDVSDAPVNPTYDGKSVKTQFAINIATPVTGNPLTRMSDVNTQNGTSRTNSFLGMYNIKLIPSAVGPTVTVANASYSVATDVAISKIISLKDLASSEIASDKSSKIYTDVNIPVGTKNFIFYGTGPFGTSISDKLEKGILTLTEDAKVGNTKDIKFQLNTIIDGSNNITAAQTSFEKYLNAIANAKAEISGSEIAWSSVTEEQNATLHGAYANFIGIGSTGARAGSADAILKTVEQLYNILSSIPSEDTYYPFVSAIQTAITGGSSSGITLTASDTDHNNVTLAYSMTDKKLKNFPRENGLPDGAMQLSFDNSNNSFSYKSSANVGTASDLVFDVNKLTYPAALAYFVNTPARATTAEIPTTGTDAWPTTVNAWDAAWESSGNYNSWTTTVNSNSRTVALQYNINYGVACLETTFQCKSGLTELEDNADAFGSSTGTNNNRITIPSNGFKVTGIIIGGQTQSVNWDFLNPTTTDRAYAVYDRYMAGKDGTSDFIYAKAGTQSDANYTLVFDNYLNPQSTSTTQEAVNIAIELENNSNAEFYGVDGKIAIGQKFYLIGKLDPNDNQTGGTASGAITWPETTKSNFPATGTNRVFIQDYTTKANFTINSLKHAYVTIPDLRASKLQLGLSVDLSWRTGLTYDVTIE